MISTPHAATPSSESAPIQELAKLFLKLGATSFGGPAAHVALMEDEVVRRRQWLTHTEFLDLLAVTNLIPGPNSTEMAIHIGHRRAGWRGMWVAGGCFILPAVIIVLGLAWTYVRFSSLPLTAQLLRYVIPVIVAVLGQALWRLGRTAVKRPLPAIIALLAGALNIMGIHELWVLAGGALVSLTAARMASRPRTRPAATLHSFAIAPLVPLGLAAPAVAVHPALWPLFLFFLKVGSVLYGSGYVLLAFLRADLVERWGWLSQSQLLDAVAVGQITPGPLFTTATFIGYLLGGFSGAAAATVGIFLPAFVFVAVSAPLVPRLRQSAACSAVLDGLNAASWALMAVVSWHIARSTLIDMRSVLISTVSAVLLLRFSVNSTWLVLIAAVIGIAAQA